METIEQRKGELLKSLAVMYIQKEQLETNIRAQLVAIGECETLLKAFNESLKEE